ncbi:HupE/UreJ family protein [Taklimakanibacter deserti]|uniref:HupE/UreJ family protein n=1 Tax=Taklimakanibacter deserti TaxID=2267839 RepID=UPI000E64C3DA
MIRLILAIWALAVIVVGQAQAHDLRPAYLALTETAPDAYAVFWKVPAMGERRLAIAPQLPRSAIESTPREGVFLADAYVERWAVRAPAGLTGDTIAIDGLAESRTDVLVRIERLNGEVSTVRLTPAAPSFEVPAAAGWQQVAVAYLWLGVEHILLGVDHLIFVLALIMLVRGWKRIALTITAFTLAHSITLGAATLGYLDVPGPPVEALIALSIALVAVEIVNAERGRQSLASRFPWLIAFAFGLLHGLGFAGALSDVGLPAHAIPAALLFFNLGVELGQLLFVAVAMALFAILHRISVAFPGPRAYWSQAWLRFAGAYCIGGIASFWLIERIYSGFWA